MPLQQVDSPMSQTVEGNRVQNEIKSNESMSQGNQHPAQLEPGLTHRRVKESTNQGPQPNANGLTEQQGEDPFRMLRSFHEKQ